MAEKLFGLAVLTRRISFLPRPLLFLVLWVLRPAEATTRAFILDLAEARGFYPVLDQQLFFECRDDRIDAQRLAQQFQTLGELLDELLWYGLCDYAAGGVQGWRPEATTHTTGCAGMLNGLLARYRSALVSTAPRLDSS